MAPDAHVDYGNAYTQMVVAGLRERQLVTTMFSGKSMLPTLQEGMRLLVERTTSSDIRTADIIMYKKGNQAVVHRVIGIIRCGKERSFVTKGDNHAYIDSDCIPEGDLIGRVSSAFFEDSPDKDALVKSRLIGMLYVILAKLVWVSRRLRRYLPKRIRGVFKYFVAGFFILFKKIIHALYLGMRHVQLFFGKCGRQAA